MTIAATLAQELCHSTIGCLCLYVFGAKKTLNPSVIKIVPGGGLERYIRCISIIHTHGSITGLYFYLSAIDKQFMVLVFIKKQHSNTVTCIHAQTEKMCAIPCDLLQIQLPARITRSALKKITFSLFNSQFLTFTATKLIANPRCYKRSGKKRSFFTLYVQHQGHWQHLKWKSEGTLLDWHWADHFTRKAGGLNERRKKAPFCTRTAV